MTARLAIPLHPIGNTVRKVLHSAVTFPQHRRATVAFAGTHRTGCAQRNRPGGAMSKVAAEHHHAAAEHHEHAARHHKEAAKHHEDGNHEAAAHHAPLAHGHHDHASHHAA